MTTVPALDHVSALRRAPEDGSLELVYQPEIDFTTGQVVAMEGLLRWHHAGELLSPGEFLPLAERSGASRPIQRWVLRAGAAEAAVWQGFGGPRRQLWLNASTHQVREPGFADAVAEAVASHGLPFGALGIELSEATVTELGEEAVPLLHELRAAGVGLAVDDTSVCSALGAMELLPLSAVKLGQEHVRGIAQDEDGAATIIGAAHDRGLYVVAEGVETWEEAAQLTALGCDRAHGWLFASAQPAEQARWLLEHGQTWRSAGTVPLPREGTTA